MEGSDLANQVFHTKTPMANLKRKIDLIISYRGYQVVSFKFGGISYEWMLVNPALAGGGAAVEQQSNHDCLAASLFCTYGVFAMHRSSFQSKELKSVMYDDFLFFHFKNLKRK